MKKLFFLLLALVLIVIPVLCSCSSTSSTTSTTTVMPSTTQSTTTSPVSSTSTQTNPTTSTSQAPTTTATTSSIVTGGTLIMEGGQLPKDIGYQPTMALTDKYGIFGAIAETLMNMNTQGQLVPELATSVDSDPAAKTITWHLRQGVQFQDGTPFNAQAAAWNFQQVQDAGTLQYGDQIANIATPDDYTLVFTLKNFSYVYVQSFSTNIYMFSSTAIQKNGKEWAITHAYGTGPFEIKSFDPTSKLVLVKNPNYWRPGLPYLNGLEENYLLDSSAISAAMETNEIQLYLGGNLVMQKDLVAKGFTSVTFVPNQTVDFLVPSSNDPNSPLSNPLVVEACEYAINRAAICSGYLQGTATPMDQMAYQRAVGYDASLARSYDVAKAKQLLTQAGFPGGKGISISIYGSNSAPSTARRTAIAGYLQAVGIDAKVVSLPFASYISMQTQGWQNGFMDCVENSGAIWPIAFLNWLGPLPTVNPIPSLARSDAYNNLAKQVLTAPDAATENNIVTQLIKMVDENSMVIPLWSQPSTWLSQPYVHTDETLQNSINFDWAKVWASKP